ncbi:sigma factor [Methylobacterium sp. NEAU 140]|uniref:sigma factor n=1 Tax=Methylobacterium sp. NEAU 140 TaxID=3064945 RepID=UPI002732EC7D|nr:sigma factor [Methylobacterium sp. NEAU 140]MDP4026102.1 sigma factor [Methylobacterium sp. NEAU 140]
MDFSREPDALDTQPNLPVSVHRHLGALLAAAYADANAEVSAEQRFADLLASLAVALDEADRRDAAEFQAGLLAMTAALRRFAISLTHDPATADDLVQETLLKGWRNRTSFAKGTNMVSNGIGMGFFRRFGAEGFSRR